MIILILCFCIYGWLIIDCEGERGLVIEGNFIKFTGIGVYLEDKAVASLAPKWKGKSFEELRDTLDFFRDIISGITTSINFRSPHRGRGLGCTTTGFRIRKNHNNLLLMD